MTHRRLLYLLLVVVLLVSSLGAGPVLNGSAAASGQNGPQLTELTVKVAPGIDLKNYILSAPFRLVFSEPMDPSSANPALLTYPYLPGDLTWSQNNTVLTFQPKDGFQANRSYYIFLDSDLKSAARKLFTKIQQWQISVLPGPAVLSYSPTGPELLDLRPLIQVNFDHAMDRESVATAIRTEPSIAFDIKWNKNQATLHPRQPLTPGQNYRITIAKTAHDTDNVPLEQEETWQYWVPELLASAQMEDGHTIHLKFNYSMAAKQPIPPFEITPPLEGEWSWDGILAIFKAEQFIPLGREYTIKAVAPLTTFVGDTLPMQPVVFIPDPPIYNYFPSGESYGNYEDIGMEFSVPMDHASTEAAFQVSPDIKGEFIWKENSLFYHLDEDFPSSTTYTVTLNPSALDANGNPVIVKPFTWSFKSDYIYQYFEPVFTFGCEGANIQVVDAAGPRSIPFHYTGSGQLSFSLYAVDLPKFVELYRAHYHYRDYMYSEAEKDAIPTAGLERAAIWNVKTSSAVVQETVFPVGVPTGVYVLNATLDGKIEDQLLVALTNKTLVIKHSGSRLWLWASDINGGDVPDLEVRLYTKDGSLMREGKTGPGGLFETTLPKDSPPMLVAVRGEGDDIAIAGFDSQWASNYWYISKDTRAINAYLYTDRPIYRPGHTINFKAVLREDDDVRYSLPEINMPVKVRVLDPRKNEVKVFDLNTNEFGTLNGSFTVAEGAGLGEYSIQAVSESSEVYGSVIFKVEDYRKPDFQVLLTAEKDRYVAGETIPIVIDTRYYFGEPLPEAYLTIRTYALQSWNWWGDAEDVPDESGYTWYPLSDQPVSAKTDKQGQYRYSTIAHVTGEDEYMPYSCQNSWRSSLRRCTLAIEVTAKDASGQEVSAVRIISVYNAAEKLTIDAGDWSKRPNEKFTITARAVSLDTDQPLANRKLRLEVTGWIWNNWGYDQQVVTTYDMLTAADGTASQEVSIGKPGSYSLRVSPYDGDSARVSARDWVYVYTGKDTWGSDSWGSFSMSAEQTRYKPYQKARLAIQSDFSGPAVLTFERGRVIHEQPVVLTAPLTVVETEIIPEYAPNVFVVVNAWKAQKPNLQDYSYYSRGMGNSSLMTAKVELQVETDQKALDITITPDKPGYAPRQEATFTIQVNDAQDRPVEAELSLALVDEAIFSLSGDLAGPIFQSFYGKRPLSVITADSLAIRRMLMGCGGGRGGGGGGDIGPSNPRSDFPDTAAWYPSLRTGKDGKASLTLTLPDSLTTWRVLVKAVTKQTQVGEGELKIVTHQDVVAQPVLPRTLTTGDQVELGALLHNYTDQSRELIVDLNAAGLEVLGTSTQKVTLKADEVQMVRWQVRANRAGETNVDITAASPEYKDAVRVPLEIRPRSMPDVVTQVGDFQGELLATLVAPETMLDVSTVEVKLSRSEAGSLLDGLEYLTGYPYGCVEQTMSRALPNAVVLRALDHLGVESTFKGQLNEMIAQGVQRLYGFQHSDGGWGWWHDDESTAYQTAWVVFGLSVTADAGYPVDQKVIERGAKYLTGELVAARGSDDQPDPRTQAYILYSLAVAGQGDREKTLALAGQSAGLDSFSQAALALALHYLDEDSAARIVLDGLAATAISADGQVYWESSAGDGEYYRKTMASSIRTTALALSAFTRIAPDHELVSGMVRYLMSRRRASGWGTTNETAYTILALTDHLQALQASGAAADYQVLLNDRPFMEGQLEWKAPLVTLKIPADQLEPGINLLKLTQTGADRLYYTITSRMFLDQPSVEAAGKVSVLREYLDVDTGKPLKKVQAGDLVRVRLTAVFPTADGAYLIVEDHLPGGLEALNERLNTTTHYGGNEYYDYYSEERGSFLFWEEYGYNQKEVYADHVSFFITGLHNATYKVDYLARAGRPGDFTAPPAQVYAMYDETIWGRSSSGAITVEP